MLKAIETVYAGRRFRSRREARWAILFDHLEIDWRFEPEGYHLPGNLEYLPDFELHLPTKRYWVEVKPDLTPNQKLALLCNGSEQRGAIVAEPMLRADVLEYDHKGNPKLASTPVLRWLRELTGIEDELKIQAASNAALSARWEHGEKPRRPIKKGGRGPRVYQRGERLLDEPSSTGGSAFSFGS